MIAPPIGQKPTTPCVTRPFKRPRFLWVTKPDGTRKREREYRIVYAAVHGWAVLEGRLIEHACDNHLCVRYGHLRLGSKQTNVDDMVAKGRHWNSRKTHCKHGHEFDEANTRIRPDGLRECRACDRERGSGPNRRRRYVT